MTPVRLEPAAPRSRVKYSTTEPLRSLMARVDDAPLLVVFGSADQLKKTLAMKSIFRMNRRVHVYKTQTNIIRQNQKNKINNNFIILFIRYYPKVLFICDLSVLTFGRVHVPGLSR